MIEPLRPVQVTWQVSPSEAALSVSMNDVSMRCNFVDGAVRRVTIRFEGVESIEQHEAVSDHEVVRESEYDWTAVPDLEPSEFFHRWRDQGVCPDPGFYEVPASTTSLYLIVGREKYVLVRASAWHEL